MYPPMNTELALPSSSEGIHFTRFAHELPLRLDRNGRWSPVRRHPDGRIDFLILNQSTKQEGSDEENILSVADPLGINGGTLIALSPARRIPSQASAQWSCRTP